MLHHYSVATLFDFASGNKAGGGLLFLILCCFAHANIDKSEEDNTEEPQVPTSLCSNKEINGTAGQTTPFYPCIR